MTGRDLIMYILANGLEDEPVFKNGKFIGYITAGEAATKMGVGVATIYVWASQNLLDSILIKDRLYISANSKSPMERIDASCTYSENS